MTKSNTSAIASFNSDRLYLPTTILVSFTSAGFEASGHSSNSNTAAVRGEEAVLLVLAYDPLIDPDPDDELPAANGGASGPVD